MTEFNIDVSEAQDIVNKLSSICRLKSDGVDGLVMVDVAGEVTFSVNNTTTGLIITSFTSKIKSTGRFVCKLDMFKSYILKFSSLVDGVGTEFFNFIVDDSVLFIKTKTTFKHTKPSYRKLRVSLLHNDTYPNIKKNTNTSVILNSSILKSGLMNVIDCVNYKELRPSLRGPSIRIDKDCVVFAATNGVKLAESIFNIETSSIKPTSFILRYDISKALVSLLDYNKQVFIGFEGNNIFLLCEGIYVIGSVITKDGFPDYKSVLNSFSNEIILDRQMLIDNITNTLGTLDDDDNSRLNITLTGNHIIFTSDRIDISQELDFEVDHISVDINGKFVYELISKFKSDTIIFSYKDDKSPLVFKSGDDSNYIVLLTNLRKR